MRGTSFSKRRNQWRAAGIEIDFGRLPLLKRRGPGHTLRTDKSCRSDQDKDKSLEAARGHDVGPVGHEQEVPSGRGPRNSWRVYQQPSRKREREREKEKGIVDSLLLLAPTPRRRAASHRSVLSNLVDLLKPAPRMPTRCALLRMDLSAFPLCHSRVTVLYDRRSCLSHGPPSR